MPISIRILAIIFLFYSHPFAIKAEDKAALPLVKKLIEQMKNDETNTSFKEMIDKVRAEHTLSNNDIDQIYFYTDNPDVITSIINLVLMDPQGVIDETRETGTLKIYRKCDYPKEIAPLFSFFGKEQKVSRKFQNTYVGQTVNGPTNKVVVILNIKGDEQNADTLEKRLAYKRNNIRYFDAHPIEEAAPEPQEMEDEPAEEDTDSK